MPQNRVRAGRARPARTVQSNLIWLNRISLSHRWVAVTYRMVPDLERITTLDVRAPPPK
jgi:hypothetical protein